MQTESSAANRDYSTKVVPQTEVPTINFNSDGVIKPKVKLTQIVHSKKEVLAGIPWESPNHPINCITRGKTPDILTQTILNLLKGTYKVPGYGQQDVFIALPVHFCTWLKCELLLVDKNELLKQMMEEIRCFGGTPAIQKMEANKTCILPAKAPKTTYQHLSDLFMNKLTWAAADSSLNAGGIKRFLHTPSEAWISIAEWALPELCGRDKRIKQVNIYERMGKKSPVAILEVERVQEMLGYMVAASMQMDPDDRNALHKRYSKTKLRYTNRISDLNMLFSRTARPSATECSVVTNTLYQG